MRGHVDPDVMELVGNGSTQFPTVSQLGRMLSCQMIVSNGWNLQLGDIRRAFLEADALDRKQGPLYSSLLSGGIPGVPDGAVILILGNIYERSTSALVQEIRCSHDVHRFYSVQVRCVCLRSQKCWEKLGGNFFVFMWTTLFVVVLAPYLPLL